MFTLHTKGGILFQIVFYLDFKGNIVIFVIGSKVFSAGLVSVMRCTWKLLLKVTFYENHMICSTERNGTAECLLSKLPIT